MQTALSSIRTRLNTEFRTRLSLTETDLVVRERTIKVRGSRKALSAGWEDLTCVDFFVNRFAKRSRDTVAAACSRWISPR